MANPSATSCKRSSSLLGVIVLNDFDRLVGSCLVDFAPFVGLATTRNDVRGSGWEWRFGGKQVEIPGRFEHDVVGCYSELMFAGLNWKAFEAARWHRTEQRIANLNGSCRWRWQADQERDRSAEADNSHLCTPTRGRSSRSLRLRRRVGFGFRLGLSALGRRRRIGRWKVLAPAGLRQSAARHQDRAYCNSQKFSAAHANPRLVTQARLRRVNPTRASGASRGDSSALQNRITARQAQT
jgi:hypothetical protein